MVCLRVYYSSKSLVASFIRKQLPILLTSDAVTDIRSQENRDKIQSSNGQWTSNIFAGVFQYQKGLGSDVVSENKINKL